MLLIPRDVYPSRGQQQKSDQRGGQNPYEEAEGQGGVLRRLAAREQSKKTPGILHSVATHLRLPFEVDGDLRLYLNRHPVFYSRLITPFFNRFQYRAS